MLAVYRGAAVVAGVGSAFGLCMAGKERLSRSERICARVATASLAAAERAADETLDRLTRAREDADTPDDAVAEQAWRQVS